MSDKSARGRNPTDDDEADIRRLNAEGLSQTETARRLGLDRPALSRWSRRRGLSWWAAPAEAVASHAERMRLRRLELADAALNDAIELRMRLWDNMTEHFVTRDGVESVTYELPPARMVSDFANAIERLTRVSENLARDGAGHTEHAKSMLGQLGEQLRSIAKAHNRIGDDE